MSSLNGCKTKLRNTFVKKKDISIFDQGKKYRKEYLLIIKQNTLIIKKQHQLIKFWFMVVWLIEKRSLICMAVVKNGNILLIRTSVKYHSSANSIFFLSLSFLVDQEKVTEYFCRLELDENYIMQNLYLKLFFILLFEIFRAI